MKLFNISLMAGVLFLSACSKSIDEKPVSFEVMSTKTNGAASTIFNTKDTIVYKLNGNPDVLTFYSGAIGQRYEFKDRITANGKAQLQFTSLRANGTQANSIQLLVSSDFKGVVAKSQTILGVITRDTAATNANIAAATWVDISSRAAWSTGTALSSGLIDLSDFTEQGKPVFIAFKYIATAGTIQNKWTITAFSLQNVLEDKTVYTQANFAASNQSITNYGINSPGLGWLSISNPSLNTLNYNWVYSAGIGTAGSLVVTGATTALTATAPAESWAIMGAVDLRKVTPDGGLAVKDINTLLKTYKPIVSYPAGAYNVTFVASNNTVDGMSVVVRQLPITITNP